MYALLATLLHARDALAAVAWCVRQASGQIKVGCQSTRGRPPMSQPRLETLGFNNCGGDALRFTALKYMKTSAILSQWMQGQAAKVGFAKGREGHFNLAYACPATSLDAG